MVNQMRFKKVFLIISIISFLSVFYQTEAQIVSFTPRFPKITDSLTLVYDATKGNAGLKDCTAIYIHSGVILGGPNATAWSNVPMTWGSPNLKWRLNNLGNNKFGFKFKPTNFYNIPSNTTVYRFGFVFRNRTGSITGKTESGGDIFTPVYQPGQQAVAFIEPGTKSFLANVGDVINYTGASNFQGDLKIFVNGAEINQALNDTTISGQVPTSTGGTKKVVIRSVSNPLLADSFQVRINQPTQIQALPAGVEDGINIISPTSVIFCLRAPGKSVVYVKGEFENWELTDAGQMKKTPDGKFWWTQINNLDPALSYGYQYFVDGQITIADPYSNIILDPNNDPFINSTIYPGLKPYPTGKTTGNVSVFKTVETPFQWTNTNFVRPEKKDLVVYELLVRDFAVLKTYKMLADTLGYLKSLGINCIQLMPIMEFEGNLSWGYNPSHHYAIDKFYGSATAFKTFVDKAHSMGMSVVLDIALNHCFGQSPLAQLYWNSTLNRPAANSPWLNEVAKHDFNVGNDFNHESPDTRYYVDRVMKHWLQEYKIDGFRWDLSKGFTQKNTLGNTNNWGLRDPARIAIWKILYDDMQSYSPGSYSILEHFAENSEEIELSNYGHMLWGNLNYSYIEASKGIVGNSNLSSGYYKFRGWTNPHLITYMESHDEERLMYRNITEGNNSQAAFGYNVRDTTTGLDRIKLASCFFYTIPGPKMIWQFGELGYGFSINYCQNGTISDQCRTDSKPIRWNYNKEPRRRSLFRVTQALIALKRFEPVFSTDDASLNVGGIARKSIKLTHPSRNVVVVGNFGVVTGNSVPNFQSTGKWYEFFTGDSITVNATNEPISLLAGEYRIYSNVRWNTPDYYINLLSNEKSISKVEKAKIFPNPASGYFEIQLPFLTDGAAEITIFDISEKQVLNRISESGGGSIFVDLKGLNLKNGLYSTRIISGKKVFSCPLLISN